MREQCPVPASAPSAVGSILRACIDRDPAKRPTPEALSQLLANLRLGGVFPSIVNCTCTPIPVQSPDFLAVRKLFDDTFNSDYHFVVN